MRLLFWFYALKPTPIMCMLIAVSCHKPHLLMIASNKQHSNDSQQQNTDYDTILKCLVLKDIM